MFLWFIIIILILGKIDFSQCDRSFIKFAGHFTNKFVSYKEVKVKTWDILNQLR